MSVRPEVDALAALGPLPSEAVMTEEIAASYQARMHAIKPPLSGAEARLLMASFGPDDGYGLAWTLLHLIETAPDERSMRSQPTEFDNEWVRLLWERSRRERPRVAR